MCILVLEYQLPVPTLYCTSPVFGRRLCTIHQTPKSASESHCMIEYITVHKIRFTTMMYSFSEEELTFIDLSCFVFTNVAAFLEADDVLTLRCLHTRLKKLVDDDLSEAESLWNTFLERDFDYHPDDDRGRREALRVTLAHLGPSVFGTTGSNAILQLPSAFETWKQWKRVARRYSGGHGDFRLNAPCKCLFTNCCSACLCVYVVVFVCLVHIPQRYVHHLIDFGRSVSLSSPPSPPTSRIHRLSPSRTNLGSIGAMATIARKLWIQPTIIVTARHSSCDVELA
jgi:hypothetical protein